MKVKIISVKPIEAMYSKSCSVTVEMGNNPNEIYRITVTTNTCSLDEVRLEVSKYLHAKKQQEDLIGKEFEV